MNIGIEVCYNTRKSNDKEIYMKLMISEDEYKKGLFKLVYRLPVELMVIGFVVILVVQLIIQLSSSGFSADILAEVGASSFFYAAILTAIVYFIKGRRFGGTFEIDPNTTVKGDIDYYLPCVEGSSIKGAKAGFLLIQGKEMLFVHKKIDGFKVEPKMTDLSQVKVKSGIDGFNPYSFLLFGVRETLILESGSQRYKFNMPHSEIVAKEIEQLLKKIQLG